MIPLRMNIIRASNRMAVRQVEPVFSAGDKLSIQYQRYTGQDEAGNDVYQTYAAELPIAGIVKSTADYTLLTTDRIFYNGMVFVSTALYHKMFEGAGSYHMEKKDTAA